MGDERAATAIGRIEKALARIESAAGRTQKINVDNDEAGKLREAHEALRGRVEGAISQIDRLLASGERT